MTVIKQVTVVCDNCGVVSEPEILVKELKAKAKKQGWKFRKGLHKCSECKTFRGIGSK